MSGQETMTAQEKQYLRELAKKQLEYANLPIMEERKQLWYLHNSLQGPRPMVVMEEETFLEEILPPSQCQTADGKWMERQLLQNILAYEIEDDDKVVPDCFYVDFQIRIKHWNVELHRVVAKEGLGYHVDPILECLEEDLEKLSPSIYHYDEEETKRRRQVAEEVLGDILPVRFRNTTNRWESTITAKAVDLMGMENMFCSMMTEPEKFHELMNFLTDDIIRGLRWQEENGLLLLNNGNDYMGSGSYCFNHELDHPKDGKVVRSTDVWGHTNSQESIGISPQMYHEFIYPYYARLAKEYGLLYYGCCEPVDPFWDDSISHYANLRKVSISPWCNEEFMAERLSGGNVIYSRKPSPNFIGVEKEFDEDGFRAYIRKTVDLTRECKTEFIFRDIYRLNGNLDKVKRAVAIVREETQR